MATSQQMTKDEQFLEDMIRCRSIEFARLGMTVEVNGVMGTIAVSYTHLTLPTKA